MEVKDGGGDLKRKETGKDKREGWSTEGMRKTGGGGRETEILE